MSHLARPIGSGSGPDGLSPSVSGHSACDPSRGWQPISTAPTDGTLFLAYAEPGQHDLPELFSLCAWHADAGFCICELREPTHWMPLPAPPAQGIEARSAETQGGSAVGESPSALGGAPDPKREGEMKKEDVA